MSFGTKDWGPLLNLFFLLGFYTSGFSAYLCARWMRCGRISSVTIAMLFAFAPYHFARGAGHLMLSVYFVVPIGILLAVRAASGQTLFSRRKDNDRTGAGIRGHDLWKATGRALPGLVLCATAGSFGSYYAIFTIISIILASATIAGSKRTIRPLVAALPYCLAIGLVFLFNILPNLLYRLQNGTNLNVADRLPMELDIYGLRLIQMLTPVPGHRFAPLRALSDELRSGYTSEGSQYLGLVASIALLAMLGWVAFSVVGNSARVNQNPRGLLAWLTLIWVLIATTGGLDWFAPVLGFSQLRAWNRVSIFIAFLVLLWLSMTVGPMFRQ